MKVLITGGTGFLGKALGRYLKQQGYAVTLLGRNPALCGELIAQGFNVIQANLEDAAAINAACKQQDYVFHCGALSSPWGKYQDFYHANVIGTKHVILGCQDNHVQRLIHVSTPSIYFNFKHQRNINEENPLPHQCVNAYAQTKLLAEQAIDVAHQSGLEVITLRPRGIFGPGDTAIIPRLINVHQKMPLPLFNEGKALIDMTYVDNVVLALHLAAQAPVEALGRKFNITNDEPMWLINLLEKLFKKLNTNLKTKSMNYRSVSVIARALEFIYPFVTSKEPPFTRYTLSLLAFDQTLDIANAKKLLGYRPKITIDEGLDRFVHSLEKIC